MEQQINSAPQGSQGQHGVPPVLLACNTEGMLWGHALQLVRSLRDSHGLSFVLAAYGRPLDAIQRRNISRIQGVELHECRVGPREEEQVASWLHHLAEMTGAGLMHLDRPLMLAAGGSRPQLMHLASDPFSRAMALEGAASVSDGESLRSRIEAALVAADAIVVPTRQMVSDLEQHFAFSTPIRVIPFGRDFPRNFYDPSLKQEMIAALGSEEDEALNPAAVRVAASELGWPVRLTGGLAGSDASERLRRASICAMPARYEPSGAAVLEAAAGGCALVLSDLPSLRENWEHAALFVDGSDLVSLRELLRFLILNPEQRDRWAQRAHERAHYFSAQRMGDAWLQEYLRVAPHVVPPASRLRSA